ncbi:MAG: sensor histidine kinase [Sphingomicrobium sp.]
MSFATRFERLSTAAKLFIILSLVMLPIGLGLTLLGASGIADARSAKRARADDQGRLTARAIESLLARNALALRIAANGAIAAGGDGVCERSRRSLSIAPAVAQNFEIETVDGKKICSIGRDQDTSGMPLVGPGAVRVGVSTRQRAIAIRMGVIGGMATNFVPLDEIKAVAREPGTDFDSLVIIDQANRSKLAVFLPAGNQPLTYSEWPIGTGQVIARIGTRMSQLSVPDRLLLLLPVLMWIAAALITWLVVNRLLIRPLRQLETAISNFQPGATELDLPDHLGPSAEIEQLRESFGRAIERIDHSEKEMGNALEGQRRLVREVHHRVKNNLQVVASLLNIHGRSASTDEARSAYAGIGRRVGALSVVHRNHFAEMEESRGIALRPLLSELSAELRGSAPDAARLLTIELDVDTVHTTQDVAVAAAFLVTEIVEFAMLNCPTEAVEISLRRNSELTARLSISSKVLNPDEDGNTEKVQFERIIVGLAKQLRSTLDRKLGRYSVELPVFPPS